MALLTKPDMPNNGITTIATASVGTGATSFDVADIADLGLDDTTTLAYITVITADTFYNHPLNQIPETLEIMKVTAVSSDTLTVVRAQFGTTAKTFASGDVVQIRSIGELWDALYDALIDGTLDINVAGTTAGITIGGSSTIQGNLNIDGGDDPKVQIRDAASISASGAGFELLDVSDTLAAINKTAGGTGACLIDINPIPDSTSASRFRFFRSVNTTAAKSMQFFKGDGSPTIHGVIGTDGVDSYFQIGGGSLGVGNAAPTDLVHIGNGSSFRGVLGLDKGSGTMSNMSYIRMQSADGTDHYLFIEDDGTVKVHTAVPSANSDGSVVGAQT